MANKKLKIIGTARRPNASDLRERDLTGLPDPSPEVARRRADLEIEQAARVGHFKDDIAVSFMRTKIALRERAEDATGSEWESGCRTRSRDTTAGTGMDEECGRGGETGEELNASVGVADLSDSTATDKTCRSEKTMRNLRSRTPIQLRLYALEREVYHQLLRTGRVRERGSGR